MKISLNKVFNWELSRYIIPRRLTLKTNPPVYQWLVFQIGFCGKE